MIKERNTQYAIHNTSYGFTLIELVITITVIGLLAGIGGPLTVKLMDSFQYSLYRKDLSESAEVVLRRIGRELPRLKNSTSVIIANAATYRFIDIDDNTIQFQLNGTNLEREYNGKIDTLAANILSFSLTYLDDEGTIISSPLVSPLETDIKFIEIDIALASDENRINYKTKIKLRNVVHLSDLFS